MHSLFDECFPVAKIRLKQKKHFTPWTARGIKKSSKRKQKLYEQFLKHRAILNEVKYKAYKTYLNRLSGIQRKATFRGKYYSAKII